MALTFKELESITNDYFMADGKKAVDIYYNTSFFLEYLLNQHKGIWERPDGGMKIRIPLEYDGQEAGFYSRGDVLNSEDRENINAAYYDWKHAYGNATVYRIDELKNSGRYAEVQLVVQRTASAQKSLTKLLAGSIYDGATGTSNRLTGFIALCNETSSLAYGGIAEDDLVAADGTKPWEGKLNSTAEGIGLQVIRTLVSDAKIRDGKNGKPDLLVTTEALYNIVADILQVQQRFTASDKVVKAGFTGLNFEGRDIFPDDYCPSGYMIAVNSNHFGFAVHQDGYFMRTPWKVIPDSPEDKTMKIFFDGNTVCNNRKAHKAHSSLT